MWVSSEIVWIESIVLMYDFIYLNLRIGRSKATHSGWRKSWEEWLFCDRFGIGSSHRSTCYIRWWFDYIQPTHSNCCTFVCQVSANAITWFFFDILTNVPNHLVPNNSASVTVTSKPAKLFVWRPPVLSSIVISMQKHWKTILPSSPCHKHNWSILNLWSQLPLHGKQLNWTKVEVLPVSVLQTMQLPQSVRIWQLPPKLWSIIKNAPMHSMLPFTQTNSVDKTRE